MGRSRMTIPEIAVHSYGLRVPARPGSVPEAARCARAAVRGTLQRRRVVMAAGAGKALPRKRGPSFGALPLRGDCPEGGARYGREFSCGKRVSALRPAVVVERLGPVVSRKRRVFSARFGPGGVVPLPRVLPFPGESVLAPRQFVHAEDQIDLAVFRGGRLREETGLARADYGIDRRGVELRVA